MVNTVIALQTLAQLRSQRVSPSTGAGSDFASDLTGQTLAQISELTGGGDSAAYDDLILGGSDGLALSPAARAAAEGGGVPTQDDDSLGAIIDRYVRQRSVMNIAFPIATPSGVGSFSLSVELDQAYRVVEFVPRREWTA